VVEVRVGGWGWAIFKTKSASVAIVRARLNVSNGGDDKGWTNGCTACALVTTKDGPTDVLPVHWCTGSVFLSKDRGALLKQARPAPASEELRAASSAEQQPTRAAAA
jgi:hypothetical protein